jgi:transposase
MQTILRQCVGIDIAKSSFTSCISQQLSSGEIKLSAPAEFENCRHGFNQFLKWVRKNADASPKATFVMEATGIYYESLAYHLHQLKESVCVVLPNKVKHYAKSLNTKSKTDEIDARVIAQMGAERALELWTPPAEVFRSLRALTRLYTDLKVEKTVFVNRLHSMEAAHEPLPFIVKSTKELVRKLDCEIEKTEKEIEKLISSDQWLKQKVERLLTIKGVGFITIAIVLAETQGFKLITNLKQLASYAGYDVVQRESGSSIKGKTRISKKGNSRIRAAMHFPALVGCRHNPEFKATYERINAGKSSKMVAATALQRKILGLIYTLWKNNDVYRPKLKMTSSAHQNNECEDNETTAIKKAGKPKSPPAQDELLTVQQTEALLH